MPYQVIKARGKKQTVGSATVSAAHQSLGNEIRGNHWWQVTVDAGMPTRHMRATVGSHQYQWLLFEKDAEIGEVLKKNNK